MTSSECRRYAIPGGIYRTEKEIERSRFIATITHAQTVESARSFVERIRAEFSDATHNCWAYLIGPPGTTGTAGMSDDGEPRGTAGRPMLTTLVHSGVGDVAVVVTRYFGGTKLGRGGLVRAYSGAVKAVLEKLSLAERVVCQMLHVTIDYATVTAFKRLLARYEADVAAESFAEKVEYRLRLPCEREGAFRAELVNLTQGEAIVEVISPDRGGVDG